MTVRNSQTAPAYSSEVAARMTKSSGVMISSSGGASCGREIRAHERPPNLEKAHRPAVDEKQDGGGGGLDAGRDGRDGDGVPGDGHDDEQAEGEDGRQRDDQGVEDELLAERLDHRLGEQQVLAAGRQDHEQAGDDEEGDSDELTEEREQRGPVGRELAAELPVDVGREDARGDRREADEEHPLPGVTEDELGVERGDAGDGADDEGEDETRVPVRRTEDEPRQIRQVSLRGRHRTRYPGCSGL
jgi:hypothetical protein